MPVIGAVAGADDAVAGVVVTASAAATAAAADTKSARSPGTEGLLLKNI